MAAARLRLVPRDARLPEVLVAAPGAVLGRGPQTRIPDPKLSKRVVSVRPLEGMGGVLEVSVDSTRPRVPPAVKQLGCGWVTLCSPGPTTVGLVAGDALALRADPRAHVYTVGAHTTVESDTAAAPQAAACDAMSSTTSPVLRQSPDDAPPPPKRLRTASPPGAKAPMHPLFARSKGGIPPNAASQSGGGAASGDGGSANYTAVACNTLEFKGHSLRLPKGWLCDDRHLMVFCGVEGAAPRDKVAAFDFDECVVKESGRFKVRPGQTGATPKFKTVIPKLRALYADGYKVVIFSNESLERFVNKAAVVKQLNAKIDRIETFIRECAIPIVAFAAVRGRSKEPSEARKPNIGMWTYHSGYCNGGIAVDKAGSFFVGDAAGRPNDFSDSDLMFARNVGIAFHDEKSYFEDYS